jgi:hypothetical protein
MRWTEHEARMGDIEMFTHCDGKHEEKHHLEDLAVYEKMLLKLFLNKCK